MRAILIVILMSFSIIARADVSSNLDDFFGKLGYESNTSGPVAYQGQAAGYYDGGSLFLRNQVKDYQ
ncbi:MAG: conjugal transfer protein TraH, partial [Candidatus Thioglobus sp.]